MTSFRSILSLNFIAWLLYIYSIELSIHNHVFLYFYWISVIFICKTPVFQVFFPEFTSYSFCIYACIHWKYTFSYIISDETAQLALYVFFRILSMSNTVLFSDPSSIFRIRKDPLRFFRSVRGLFCYQMYSL